ncbi:DUF2235 domain-containing protein (plasmid) [Bradyrhizobium guangxiense]
MIGELAGEQPKKRTALFLDGTWNTTNDNTNVWRLRALAAPVGADQVRQSIYSNAGLGTQVGSKVRGGVFGVGIDDILLETYQWLVENYNDGDDIFIFGFSQGILYGSQSVGLRLPLRRAEAPAGHCRSSSFTIATALD